MPDQSVTGGLPPIEVSVDSGQWVTISLSPATVGRLPSSSVPVTHPDVSREHGMLIWTGVVWAFQDLGSSNGSWVDGLRLTSRCPVRQETTFRLGTSAGSPVLRVRPVGAPAKPNAIPTSGARVRATRLTVGRAPDNDIVIDDLMVSRHHAVIRIGADPPAITSQATLTDLRSVNGTFVDGHQVKELAELKPGQDIQIGSARLRFEDGTVRLLPVDETVLLASGVTVVTPDGVTRLRAVDLAVRRGELVAVVGPSGAGKSTLLGVLTGTRRISSGRVVLAGRSLRDSYDELRQIIGYVPQDDIVHPQLTPRQELRYAAELRMATDVSAPERERLVNTVLGQLGLTEAADRPISKLSGGQRKRTNVALELLTKPPIMFLDEPTSGLDPGHDKSLMQQLRALADDGRAVLVVTHNVAHLDVCDRVLVLAPGGHTAFLGSPGDTLSAFGARDFAEVFQALEREVEHEWQGRTTSDLPPPSEARVLLPIAHTAHTWRQRFSVLERRYLAIIAADRRNLILLLGQAPLLGLLIRAIGNSSGLATGLTQPNATARRVLFTLVLCATWLGASNAIREIVKERAIYTRERLIDVPISAYLASKAVALMTLTLIQSLVLMLVALGGRPGPSRAALLGSGQLELLIDVWLAGCAGVCLGLLVSAVVLKPDKAMTILPLLLVPQFVLCGGVLPLRGTPALDPASYFCSSRWGFAAAASTVDIRNLELATHQTPDPPISADHVAEVRQNDSDPLWGPGAEIWLADVAVLVLMSGASLAAAGRLLARSERQLIDARPAGARLTRWLSG